jgi:acetyl esterase
MKYPETPLNPELLSLTQKMKEIGLGPVDFMTVELSDARLALQKQYAYLNTNPIDVSKVQEFSLQYGDVSINVRVYFPETEFNTTTVGIYLHGGGWTFGNEQTHDGIARAFCKASQLPIASIGYSLAPQKKFPFQNQQIANVLEQLSNSFHEQLGVSSDTLKFIFIGDSAGANLAVATHQYYLSPTIRSKTIGMVLFYGVFSSNTNADSWQRLGDGRYGLSTKAMHWYWQQYLQNDTQQDLPEASPLLADLASFPQTFLVVGNLDPLLDDTLHFAEQLRSNQIPHQVIVLEDYPHGFLRFCNHITEVYDIIKQSGLAMQHMIKGIYP